MGKRVMRSSQARTTVEKRLSTSTFMLSEAHNDPVTTLDYAKYHRCLYEYYTSSLPSYTRLVLLVLYKYGYYD